MKKLDEIIKFNRVSLYVLTFIGLALLSLFIYDLLNGFLIHSKGTQLFLEISYILMCFIVFLFAWLNLFKLSFNNQQKT